MLYVPLNGDDEGNQEIEKNGYKRCIECELRKSAGKLETTMTLDKVTYPTNRNGRLVGGGAGEGILSV
jgi:hypothetical protein